MRVIVDSMSLKEIHDVAKEDTMALVDVIRKKFSEEYKRELKSRTVFKPILIERPNGITWHVRYCVDNYAQYKRDDINFILYGVVSYNGAKYAICPVNQFRQYIFYPPYFFMRYKERCMKYEKACIAKARDSFFKKNHVSFIQKLSDDSNEVLATVAEGTALGVQYGEDKMIIFKTFVSPEQLYSAQERVRKEALSRLTIHEIDENFIDVPGHGY